MKDVEPKNMRKRQLLEYLEGLPREEERQCTTEIKPGDIAFTCLTCSNDPSTVFCKECFYKGDHHNHIWYSKNSSFGECDCGDLVALCKGSSCTEHSCNEQIYLSYEEFNELLSIAKNLLEKINNDILAFDIPENVHLIDALSLSAIYGNSSVEVDYLYEIYLDNCTSYDLSENEAKGSYFGQIILKKKVSKCQAIFYGSTLASNMYFRVSSAEALPYFSGQMINTNNEAFFDALVEVLNEPQGILIFASKNMFNNILTELRDWLSKEIRSDSRELFTQYYEEFECFEEYTCLCNYYADIAIHKECNMNILALVSQIHEELIDVYKVSVLQEYDNNRIFLDGWFNYINMFYATVFRMCSFMQSLNMDLNMDLQELSLYKEKFEPRRCIFHNEREYFENFFSNRSTFKKDGYFCFIPPYENALYLAYILFYSEVSLLQLFETWNFNFPVDDAIEYLLNPILYYFELKFDVLSANIEKQNLYEFQNIVAYLEMYFSHSLVLGNLLFIVRTLLASHSHVFEYLRTMLTSDNDFILFLSQLLYYPKHTQQNYFLSVLASENITYFKDQEIDEIIAATRMTSLEVYEQMNRVMVKHNRIMADDIVECNQDYFEYVIVISELESTIMKMVSNGQSLLTKNFYAIEDEHFLDFLPDEYLCEINNMLTDELPFSIELLIFRILKCKGHNYKRTLFIEENLEPLEKTKSAPAVELSSKMKYLKQRVNYQDSELWITDLVLEVDKSNQTCAICHQSDGNTRYFPVHYSSHAREFSYCEHRFHEECLHELINTSEAKCPICEKYFNAIEQEFTEEELQLSTLMYNNLSRLFPKNPINESNLKLLMQLPHDANNQVPENSYLDMGFFDADTRNYVKQCADGESCCVCREKIVDYTFECPQCRQFLHAKCCRLDGAYIECACGHIGVFCIERLQYLLAPVLVYPVPYKNNAGKMVLSVFDFVKILDTESVEKLQELVATHQYWPLTKESFELFTKLFNVDIGVLRNVLLELNTFEMVDMSRSEEDEEEEISEV